MRALLRLRAATADRRSPQLAVAGGIALLLLAAGGPGAAEDPLARAVTEQRQRVAASPGDASVWNDLGNLLALAGDAAEAESAYRSALALDATSGTAHYNLGRLLLEIDRRRQARRELERALEFDPTHAAAHYYLGAVHEAQGRFRRARRAYRRAFELDPRLVDPALNPHVLGSRQALAAQLQSWMREPPEGPSRRYLEAEAIAREAGLPEPEAKENGGAAPAPAGGVVRSVRGAPAVAPEIAAETDARPSASGAPATRKGAASRESTAVGGVVLDARALRDQRVVNQAGGDAGNSGTRPGSRTGRTSPGRTGRSTTSPPSPRPSPFRPSPESTGRIEIGIEPVAAAAVS